MKFEIRWFVPGASIPLLCPITYGGNLASERPSRPADDRLMPETMAPPFNWLL